MFGKSLHLLLVIFCLKSVNLRCLGSYCALQFLILKTQFVKLTVQGILLFFKWIEIL